MTEKNGGNSTSGVQWVDFMLSCTTQAVFDWVGFIPILSYIALLWFNY